MQFPLVPQVSARILVDGQIRTSGFDTRKVRSTFAIGDHATKTGTILGETANVGPEIVLEAVDAAVKAWSKGLGAWPTARMGTRIDAVIQLRDRMLEHREMICRFLMWEIGKNWTDAQSEFDRTIIYIDSTLDEIKSLDRESSRFQSSGGIMAQIRRTPLGVTLCMGPFNYPLNETFTTLIPALLMGNTIVAKLPRYGDLLWDFLLEPFRDCFPAGVINIINGLGRKIIGPAIQSGKIDVLAFIGSSVVANTIKTSHPNPNRLRSILGLDAKNPAIVLSDANLDLAIAECLRGSLSFNGQRCTALKILFVHRSLATEFAQRFAQKVDALSCGLPWDANVQITPLPDDQRPQYLSELIQDAVAHGAKLCNPQRGGRIEGALFYPAVLSKVSLKSRVAREEQFGPVVPIVEFDTLEEVENYMMNSNFGSQVSIFGQDPQTIGRLIDRFANQVCRININAQCQRGPDNFPFTGRKDSAEGTLSVFDALRAFSIRSMVAAKEDDTSKDLIHQILDQDASHFLSHPKI